MTEKRDHATAGSEPCPDDHGERTDDDQPRGAPADVAPELFIDTA